MDPLGMADDSILDSQITASSTWNGDLLPENGRLDFESAGNMQGAWVAGMGANQDINQWIQVDFDGTLTTITGVIIQGRENANQWVTKYKVQYSNDGTNWQYVKDVNNLDAVSVGIL